MMLAHQKFDWCLSVVRLQFQIAGQDIFSRQFRRAIPFYVIAGLWTASLAFHVITIIDYTGPVQIINLALLCVGAQVRRQ